ncbi:MAG: hypothetical protein ACRDY5_02360, partial [Acidimicrobiales bacterium]
PWPVSTHSTPPCSSWPRYEVAEMSGQVELQEREFALEAEGCNATRHQREVGADYFDEVATVFSGGRLPPPPWQGSTEAAQFDHGSMAGTASA